MRGVAEFIVHGSEASWSEDVELVGGVGLEGQSEDGVEESGKEGARGSVRLDQEGPRTLSRRGGNVKGRRGDGRHTLPL